ncbi:MAG TPA: hypothetical protein VFU23_13890 [Gemmatimonadales bacterium]|nr:hypothetical protein [Gemmatimonadales bacterium]
MSVRNLTVAALLASAVLSPVAAQGKPDFSGSWKVNTEKSDPMGGGMGGGGGGGAAATITITQSATKLTVETHRGEQVTTATYNLDGSESVNTTQRGESKSKATWDGASLVINSESSFTGPNGAMTVTSKEVRTLSADGKTMTVVRTSQTPNGEMTRKTVYDKQ